MKTIGLILVCPVLLAGCGKVPPAELFTGGETVTGRADPAPEFTVQRPDSLVTHLVLAGGSPLKVVAVFPADTVAVGDTAALCADPFLQIETDRLIMELEFAIATGDTAAVHSLQTALADSSVYVPLVFAAGGRMELEVSPGDAIEPGDTVAVVTGPPPDSVYVLVPPQGHLRWPEALDGVRLPSGALLVEGAWPGDSVEVQGFYSVAQHLIHEEGLSTFLLTVSGDTIRVTVTGNGSGVRTVFSTEPLDSLVLSGWN